MKARDSKGSTAPTHAAQSKSPVVAKALIVVAAALIPVVVVTVTVLAAQFFSVHKLGLFDVQRGMALGKKTIVVPAESRNSDLKAIVARIKEGEGITLDLSKTKITDIDKAFNQCQALKVIILPNGLKSIGDYAFWGCSTLARVRISSSITSIGKNAFGYCRNLTKVTIPESVTSIGYAAFNSCESLAQVTIPESVTSIGGFAFWECEALRKVKFADTSGWYFDKKLTRRVEAAELASSLKDGKALYKKTR